MEYPKKINLLNNAPNHATKFRTKNWVEINIAPVVKINIGLQC